MRLLLSCLYQNKRYVDQHTFLDLCMSILKYFRMYLLDRTCSLTCTPSVKKFSLWSSCPYIWESKWFSLFLLENVLKHLDCADSLC